jgi:hypothetical protein
MLFPGFISSCYYCYSYYYYSMFRNDHRTILVPGMCSKVDHIYFNLIIWDVIKTHFLQTVIYLIQPGGGCTVACANFGELPCDSSSKRVYLKPVGGRIPKCSAAKCCSLVINEIKVNQNRRGK